jgi:hypothetical protein
MLVPEPENPTPKQPNEKLSWRTYRYAAISCGHHLCGTITLDRRMTRSEIDQKMQVALTARAVFVHYQWDCFNVNFAYRGV